MDFEVLFNKELKRRGLEGASSDEADKKAESRKCARARAAHGSSMHGHPLSRGWVSIGLLL